MGTIDIDNAERPTRTRVGGVDARRMGRFRQRFPPAAKRHLFIRDGILEPMRDTPDQYSELEKSEYWSGGT